MPALMSVLALAVLLSWSGGASAMANHKASAHAAHQHATGTATPVARLSMPDDAAPCHHGQGRARPPCCAGLACVAMPVGLAAESLSAPEPGRGADRPAGASLLDGVGVPPDLPPPRLG
ncbi:hypothetical protein [Azospirillum doebereinerae]|uniref:CopL family metal-binding regulatory protein n=1 Tax=Azospirillum doebereinerae TaxID=92933 RepID=A0A433J8G3_9PROT|nr:hypothetical protein [Azospirillum doebereinerae]RUQ70258.1 hypothetical protein EJ913_14795 [Azospirillum doebereinerae]